MSIKLEVEDYCQEGFCGRFEPDVTCQIAYGNKPYYATTIRCKHRDDCNGIASYFIDKEEREKRIVSLENSLLPQYRSDIGKDSMLPQHKSDK